MDFRQLKVDELKKYLKDRGIQSNSHRKESLIRLAEAACDMNFPVNNSVEVEHEYKVSNVVRRSVPDSFGDTLVLPDVSTVLWNKNLSALPPVEMGDLMVYLLNKCGWSSERLKNYKSDNAYQLYMCGHVSDVRLCQCDSNYMYVKGSCIPETRQAERPYDSWILLDNTGSIHSGGCTCVADDGSCKHCIALVLAVQNFCERHQDRNTEVGTDSGCKWDKPRKRSEPTLLKDIQYGKQEQCREIFTPNKEELESKSQKSLENMVYRLCKGTNALFLQTTEPPSDDSDSDSDDELQNFSDMVNCVKKQCGSNFQCIINELSKKHTSEYIAKVENSTKGQHENELWFKHRQGRITASLAHSVLKCNLEKLKPENYIVRSIKGNTLPFSTAATKYGKDMEKVAYSMYVTKVRHSHKKFVPSSCGLFISKEFPFLAASPDGKVECLCCGKGLLEIKCSYSFRHKTPFEVASDKDYYLYVQDGEVRLKKNTSWYTQIQTQLGVCELQYCDFVFFTLKGIAVERIYFDTDIYTQIKEKSNLFVQKYLL